MKNKIISALIFALIFAASVHWVTYSWYKLAPVWFFIDYQDRVMFGKDTYKKSEFDVYFRVLESSDEYFDYYRKRHGLWKMYGLNLPDMVLKKLYYQNALKLFPSIDSKLFE